MADLDEPELRDIFQAMKKTGAPLAAVVNNAETGQEILDFLAMLDGIKPLFVLGRGVDHPDWVAGMLTLAHGLDLVVIEGPYWDATPFGGFPGWYGDHNRSLLAPFRAHYICKDRKIAAAAGSVCDAGGRLSQSHWDQIETAIRPSVDRLGQIFPSYEDYTAPLKNAPFLQPWTPYHETYFQYETEALAEGVRSRTLPGPIRQDLSDVRRVDTVVWQRQVTCPVLVLGATEGLLSPADRLLPADVARDIEQEMPQARIMALPDTDHFSILFGENAARDQHLRRFLSAG